MIAALDLLNEVADRLSWPQFTTLEEVQPLAEHRKLLRLLNRVLESLGAYNDWPLLREEATIVMVAAVQSSADPDDDASTDDGQFITATQNSKTITVSNYTGFTEAHIGWAFQASGDEYIYRVATVPSTSSITLNRAWVNDSVAASDEIGFTMAMDRYALPEDFGRPVDDWQNAFAPYKIKPRTPNQFRDRRRERSGILLADPDIFTIYGLQNGRQVVHFDPFPENARMLQYEYQKRHPVIDSDQDQILYPHSYLGVLIDVLVQLALRDYEDSAKMQTILQDVLRGHNLQQSNAGVTESRPVMEPGNSVRRSMRVAYGLPTVNIDWGDAFDTGELHGL